MLSSSPDPLAASTGPVVTSRTRQSSVATTTPSKMPRPASSTSGVNIESPRKMTATSNSILSPWRIKVVVEAERDSGSDNDMPIKRSRSPSQSRSRQAHHVTLGLDEEGAMTVINDEQPKAARKKRTPTVRTRTTTTKVPLKGGESSSEKAKEKTPRARSRARKTPTPGPAGEEALQPTEDEAPKTKSKPRTSTAGTTTGKSPVKKSTAASRRKRAKKTLKSPEETLLSFLGDDDAIAEDQPEAPELAPEEEPAHMPKPTPKPTPKKTPKKPRYYKPVEPTAASTRSRRASLAPNLSSTPGIGSTSVANDSTSSTVNGHRLALGGKNTNDRLLPATSKKDSLDDMRDTIVVATPHLPSTSSNRGKSTSRASRSLMFDETKSLAISEGATMSLPDITGQQAMESSDDEDFGGDDTFAGVSREPAWVPPSDVTQEKYDFTYLSNGMSYTPRVKKKSGLSNEIRQSNSPTSLGVKTFYGVSPEKKDREDDDDEDDDFQGSILPEDLTGPSVDFTGVSSDKGYSPRHKKRMIDPAEKQINDSYERAIQVQSFYKQRSKLLEEDQDEEISDVDEAAEPMEADFTYVAHGPSYTPRVKKKGALSAFNMPSSEYPENSITAESFYDLPSSSTGRRDKGKGRAVEEQTGGLTQEESPDLSSPAQPSKERSFYPSSPPSKEVVEADVSEPDLPELVTPLDRNIAEPVNPPLAGRQRIERYTPNISRVVEKAGILSDALEIDEAMRMAEQHFGHGVGNNAPPTPESRQDTPPTRPDGQQEDSPTQGKIPADSATDVHVEYPSLDGMLSPPPSQEAQAAASNKAGKQTPSNNKSKIFSHVRQSISGPSSLASSSTPKSALKMATTTTTTTTEMSWQSTAKSQISHGPSVHFNDEEQESSEITNSSDLRARDASVDDVEDTIAMDELDDESMADQSFDLRGNLVQEDTQTMIERAAAREAQWQAERDENARRAREVGVFEILSDDDDAEEAPVNESYSRSFQPGERTRLREEEYARERSTVRRRAAEVGAITIDDTTVAPGEDTIANMNNTTAFNDSLARHLDSGNLASSPFRLPERISVSPSPAGSSASRNSTASASSPPVIDLTADSVRAKTRAPRTRTQKWTTDNYRTLAAILKSSGTIPLATKRYSVMMNAAMVPELIEPEVLDLMGLDEEGYMVLDARESAAVERFVERERKVGVKWNKVEVVRRVAGVRICALRARVERMRTEAARSRGMALPR